MARYRLKYIIFGGFRATFRTKITIVIDRKFEIMLDIIVSFWEIWLDIVLSTSFCGGFNVILAEFPSKITKNWKFLPFFPFYPVLMVLLG